MHVYDNENIVAQATPPGKSALAIVRVSGLDLSPLYRSLFHSSAKHKFVNIKKLYHPKTNKALDESVVIYFKAPNSFTGEDLIEITCHGGNVVPRSIMQAIVDAGARIASPGEFSYRAYLNGKIDLLQAEAISSLILSKSREEANSYLNSATGSVSLIINEVKKETIDFLAIIENELNFSEEEITHTTYKDLSMLINNISIKLKKLIDQAPYINNRFGDFKIVFIGKSNAGKSSLFNSVIGQNKAIVSDLPGTTRDIIEERLEINGVPVALIDTAGIWEGKDRLDRLGIEKTGDAIKSANLILLVDPINPESLLNLHVLQDYRGEIQLIKSKVDLDKNLTIEEGCNVVYTSSKTGLGIDMLSTMLSTFIKKHVDNNFISDDSLLNHRQKEVVASAYKIISIVSQQLEQSVSVDIVASTVRSFIILLEELVGVVDNQEIINNIFSRFCVGK